MTAMKRRPLEAVRALENLQQQERRTSGLPLLTDNPRKGLEEAIRRQRMKAAVDVTALSATPGTEAFYRQLVKHPDIGPQNEAEIPRLVDEAVRQFSLDTPDQWSRYEYPVAATVIAAGCRRIEHAIDRFRRAHTDPDHAIAMVADVQGQSWTLPRVPVVGTLATGQFAAQAQFTPGGHPVILIENGLFKLANLMTALALVGASEASQSGFSSATVQLAADIGAAHAVLGTTLGVYERQIPPAFPVMVQVVSDCLITFVISHEYGHLLRGDLEAHALATHGGWASRDAEFAADELALRICLLAERRPGYEGAPVVAALLYLAALDFLTRIEHAFAGVAQAPDVGSEYPSPQERANTLMDRLLASPLGPPLTAALRAGTLTYRTVHDLSDRVASVLPTAHDELTAYAPRGDEGDYEMEKLHAAVVRTMWRHCRAAFPGL